MPAAVRHCRVGRLQGAGWHDAALARSCAASIPGCRMADLAKQGSFCGKLKKPQRCLPVHHHMHQPEPPAVSCHNVSRDYVSRAGMN